MAGREIDRLSVLFETIETLLTITLFQAHNRFLFKQKSRTGKFDELRSSVVTDTSSLVFTPGQDSCDLVEVPTNDLEDCQF